MQPLPRSASFEMEDLVVAGEDFSAELPFNRVSAGPDAATFSPNWFPGTPGIDGLAYAIYSFSIPNFSGSEKLSYFWKNAPTNPERAFIALANFDTDAWDWRAGNAEGKIEYASFDPYFVAGGNMLVAMVLTGEAVGELDSIRIGGLPPQVSLSASVRGGILPFATTLTAQASDPDNAIAEYLWDPEGDGSFDISTAAVPELVQQLTVPGTFQAAVKVVDAEGIFTVESITLRAYAPGAFTVGGIDSDGGQTCLLAPDGRLLLVGHSQFGLKDDLLFCSVSPEGVVDFARIWGGSDYEAVNAALLSSDGFVYLTGSDFSNDAVLLQKWDTDGNLIWTRGLGVTGNAVAKGLTESADGQIVLCGDLVPTAGQEAIAAFDSDGTLLWARGVGDVSKICLLADCQFFQPAAGPGEIRCCGTIINDSKDLLYLSFNTAGDLQSSLLYGDVSLDETANSMTIDPAGESYILGGFDFVAAIALLARVGGKVSYVAGTDTSDDIYPAGIHFDDGRLQVLLAGVIDKGFYGLFDTSFALQSMQAFGSSQFIYLSGLEACGPAGALCAGTINGPPPSKSSYSPTVADFSNSTWSAVSPPVSSVSIFVKEITTEARELNGFTVNNGGNDGNACIVLLKMEN
ncbi:hypothetical protein IT575_15130 [bacterium]|nr:hypothetical protein [bacterium]